MNTLINNNGIDVSVTINGRPVKVYSHEGKLFIESREGTEYAIEIKNNNWYRVEAVVAIDGLSILSGKTASKTDVGYVIRAKDKILLKGFRKNLEEVGAFKFTKKESSYAATKGQSSNVGVIAIAVYGEKCNPSYPTYVTLGDTWTDTTGSFPMNWKSTNVSLNNIPVGSTDNTTSYHCSTGDLLRSCSAEAKGQSLSSNVASYSTEKIGFAHGTTWGEKLQDKVVNTEFTRDKQVFNVEIFYNSKENLEAMGIKLVQEKLVSFPRGFPADFCTPPDNWPN